MKLTLAISGAASLILSLILLRIFIPVLKSVKLGQKILDIGPRWHKSKEGTPMMGGLFFGAAALAASLAAFAVLYSKGLIQSAPVFAVSVGFAILNFLSGFADDYIKLFKKRNKGLSATAKLLIQIISTAAYLFALTRLGYTTELFIPFLGSVDLGFFWYPVMLIGTVYFVNCVNLTDGIDGLAGSITFIVTVFLSVLSAVKGTSDVLVVTVPLSGALVGFLFYNIHPAKIFMGDTGSLMLGGVLAAAAFMMKMQLVLAIAGFVYIFEGLSVMLQVASFKLTGKRIFKMSPLHHHFEMCGWSEAKIVVVFSAVTVLLCVAAYFGAAAF